MVSIWLVAAIVIILAAVVIFKTQDLIFVYALIKKNFFFFLTIMIVLFVSFSLYTIHTKYEVDLTSFEGVRTAGKLYWAWFASLFDNVGSITGYVVKQDWVLNNSANVTVPLRGIDK